MANYTFVFPYTPELDEWLGDAGIDDLPASASTVLTVNDVRALLQELDWPFDERESSHNGKAIVDFSSVSREGSWPPFSEISAWPDNVNVRRGGYPAYVIAVRGARDHGPQVAFDEGGAGPVLVNKTTTYEEFCHGFGYEANLERDSAWSPPETPEHRHRWTSPPFLSVSATDDELLDYAISGERGCGYAGQQLGFRIQAGAVDVRLLHRLAVHVSTADVPIPELVWALGQNRRVAPPVLLALRDRLAGRDDATETWDMVRVFVR